MPLQAPEIEISVSALAAATAKALGADPLNGTGLTLEWRFGAPSAFVSNIPEQKQVVIDFASATGSANVMFNGVALQRWISRFAESDPQERMVVSHNEAFAIFRLNKSELKLPNWLLAQVNSDEFERGKRDQVDRSLDYLDREASARKHFRVAAISGHLSAQLRLAELLHKHAARCGRDTPAPEIEREAMLSRISQMTY